MSEWARAWQEGRGHNSLQTNLGHLLAHGRTSLLPEPLKLHDRNNNKSYHPHSANFSRVRILIQSSQQSYEGGDIIIPILQMKKLVRKEVA